MNDKWIFVDRVPVAEPDLMKWAHWIEQNREARRVARTETKLYLVSTVFLGIDNRFGDAGPPLLFETMSFDREHQIMEIFGKLRPVMEEHEQVRYSTYDDAVAGHEAMVSRYLRSEEQALKQLEEATK